MRSKSFVLKASNQWAIPSTAELDSEQTLVLAFGARSLGDSPELFNSLRAAFPKSCIVGCSTSGEIHDVNIYDGTLVVAACRFASTKVRLQTVPISDAQSSFSAGAALAAELDHPELRAVFLLSDGLHVNGSKLISGLGSVLSSKVVITGGLAGDGDRFQKTWVLSGAHAGDKKIVAVGLYGAELQVGHGSKGGWDTFGPERIVTRSSDNVLYELGGRAALDVYKEYLGELASGLPASALLFPLAMQRGDGQTEALVRTVLAVDEEKKSMTFAGDLPEGSRVRLMRANFTRLVDGAGEAARLATSAEVSGDSLSIAVSCIGRRLVLGERAEDEVEAAFASLPKNTQLVGFYSYGEVSPLATGSCELHNQTMTLTTLHELPAKQR